jgi:hypothetical protein
MAERHEPNAAPPAAVFTPPACSMAMRLPVSSMPGGSPGPSGGETTTVSINARAASRTPSPSPASSASRRAATRFA